MRICSGGFIIKSNPQADPASKMNGTRLLFIILGLCVASSLAIKTYFPNCSAAPSTYCKRTNCNIWYVDPVAGKPTNNGTFASPWSNFTLALNQLQAKYIKTTYSGPFPIPDSALADRNPTGKILPGDVIVLRTGNYPIIDIRNYYVSTPITIMGEPGRRPVIDHLNVLGTSNFIFTCLNFTTKTPGPADTIVYFSNIGYMGAHSYNNVFTKNTIFSYPDITPFKTKPQEYLFNASSAAFGTRDSYNNEVSYNFLYNIKRGFTIMSEYCTVRHNVINYFIGDGFRVLDNNTVVENNLVMNSMNVDNNADHRDGVQFFTNGNAFNLTNIIIRNNIFIADQDKTRPFFAGFQGISGFDVYLFNVSVVNNLVVTIWNWHGISLWKSVNCNIIGNTVLDVSGNATYYPWISTTGGLYGNVVQNNIAHAHSDLVGVYNFNSNVLKHWTKQELQSYFVDPFNFNLRLKDNGSNPFIGHGNATNAPTTDNDGNIRSGAYDVGCYAYHPLTPATRAPTVGSGYSNDEFNTSQDEFVSAGFSPLREFKSGFEFVALVLVTLAIFC